MKSVFILGAGMVSRPLVQYLLEKGYRVTIGDLNEKQAIAVVDGHPHGQGMFLDIAQTENVSKQVALADLVISLLPPKFHMEVAKLCVLHGKDFLTASYLSPEMEALHEEVQAKGLIFLNEVGLDPGLDHITAMEMIDTLYEKGYRIEKFDSHCGGIPSRKAANNPLRYKLSWSPAGVLGAITRASRFRRNSQLMVVPAGRMLEYMEVVQVPGWGVYESTPNADSLYYGDRYGLDDVPTVRRGTLRYPGWAQFWIFMVKQGFNERTRERAFENEQVLDALFLLNDKKPPQNLFAFVQEEVGSHASAFLEILDSLGMLDPNNRITGTFTCFDIVLRCMEATLQYEPDERDLVVLHHEFYATKDGRRERWTSTIGREGTANETAMAFLVGVPAGIAARLILERKIENRGVLIPLSKDIYRPILEELQERGLPHHVTQSELT